MSELLNAIHAIVGDNGLITDERTAMALVVQKS